MAVVRRQSDPRVVQKLWEVIEYIRSQKQVANVERVCKGLSKTSSMSVEEVEEQLKSAVEDELIMAYKAVAQKGNNAGLEQDGFRVLKSDEEDKSDHDWYCYECHLGGSVVECGECWRVFHSACVPGDGVGEGGEGGDGVGEEKMEGDVFVCAICKELMEVKKQSRYHKTELNKLLDFTILRLKEKSKELHFFCGADLGLNRFVFYYMDLNIMQQKAQNRKYKYLEQFYSDALTILHNIFICYGDSGILPHLARVMIRDCKYDLDEIRQCKDCYMHSNVKPKDWFCQPCHPRHDLVYAKQKGFTFWPAKVIKVTPQGSDVRFFGSQHQRAVIPQNNMRPIDSETKSLSLKRTAGFSKAMKELNRHKELVEQQQLEHESTGEQSPNDLDDDMDKEEPPMKMPRSEPCVKRPSSPTPSIHTHPTFQLGVVEENNYTVSSSEDKIGVEVLEGATKVVRKSGMASRQPTKSTQTDRGTTPSQAIDPPPKVVVTCSSSGCECESLVARMQVEKQAALDELEKKLWKESLEEQQRALNRALTSHQREMERVQAQMQRLKEDGAEEIKQMTSKNRKEVSVVKKKQWCYNCEDEAMYHCCWNTSYCSIKCQQDHWHSEHKRMCRRKRN